MQFSHILMFIAGGFVSAFIFYPFRKVGDPEVQKEFLAMVLSLQFWQGVHFAQNHDTTKVKNFDDVHNLALISRKDHFEVSAHTIKQMRLL